MVLTEHLTDDARTLLVGLRTDVVNVHHTVEDTAVDGLETVADIRKGTGYDD